LQHAFIQEAKSVSILNNMIQEALNIMEEESAREDRGGGSRRSPNNSQLVNPTMVSQANATISRPSIYTTAQKECDSESCESRSCSSSLVQATSDGMQAVRTSIQKQGSSDGATNIILKSWRHGTTKQYKVNIDKWTKFCGVRIIDPSQRSLD